MNRSLKLRPGPRAAWPDIRKRVSWKRQSAITIAELFFQRETADSAFSGQENHDATAHRLGVPLVTLDVALQADERPVDFIKCDVEGAEMPILRGAAELIVADKPLLILEAEMPTGATMRPRVDESRKFVEPLGYQALAFDYDGELRLGRFDELAVGHANVAFVPADRSEFQALLHTSQLK